MKMDNLPTDDHPGDPILAEISKLKTELTTNLAVFQDIGRAIEGISVVDLRASLKLPPEEIATDKQELEGKPIGQILEGLRNKKQDFTPTIQGGVAGNLVTPLDNLMEAMNRLKECSETMVWIDRQIQEAIQEAQNSISLACESLQDTSSNPSE